MTEETQIPAERAFKSKRNFEGFISSTEKNGIDEVLTAYPHNTVVVHICDLTQNIESLLNAINEFGDITPYIVWTVANEKENILKAVRFFNRMSIKNAGIFVFKASLNEDKIDFECLVKPTPNTPMQSRSRNKESKASVLQEKFWQKYFEVCDAKGSDMQINPAPQHWQYIPIGKSGVSINLTVSTKEQYIGCEILINKDKEIFYNLQKQKNAIEKQLGELDWQELPNKKSSRIRKTYPIDITNEANVEEGATALIEMAEQFKSTFGKCL